MPRFNGKQLVPNTDTIVYSAPAGRNATVSVNITNTGVSAAYIRLAFLPSGSTSPTPDDYIDFNFLMQPGATLERTAITPYNSESISARADKSGVTVMVWGLEQNPLG